MHNKVGKSIKLTVTDAGQSKELARLLERWFKAVTSGNEELNDRDRSNRRLELLYDKVRVE